MGPMTQNPWLFDGDPEDPFGSPPELEQDPDDLRRRQQEILNRARSMGQITGPVGAAGPPPNTPPIPIQAPQAPQAPGSPPPLRPFQRPNYADRYEQMVANPPDFNQQRISPWRGIAAGLLGAGQGILATSPSAHVAQAARPGGALDTASTQHQLLYGPQERAQARWQQQVAGLQGAANLENKIAALETAYQKAQTAEERAGIYGELSRAKAQHEQASAQWQRERADVEREKTTEKSASRIEGARTALKKLDGDHIRDATSMQDPRLTKPGIRVMQDPGGEGYWVLPIKSQTISKEEAERTGLPEGQVPITSANMARAIANKAELGEEQIGSREKIAQMQEEARTLRAKLRVTSGRGGSRGRAQGPLPFGKFRTPSDVDAYKRDREQAIEYHADSAMRQVERPELGPFGVTPEAKAKIAQQREQIEARRKQQLEDLDFVYRRALEDVEERMNERIQLRTPAVGAPPGGPGFPQVPGPAPVSPITPPFRPQGPQAPPGLGPAPQAIRPPGLSPGPQDAQIQAIIAAAAREGRTLTREQVIAALAGR